MTVRRLVEGIVMLPSYIVREGRDIMHYVKKIIDRKISVSRGNFIYVLCKPEAIPLENGGERALFSEMLKMSRSTKEQYFDEDSWLPVEEERPEKHIRTFSRFLLFEDGGVVLEDAYPQLSRNTFADMLEKLLHEAIKDEEAIFRIQVNFKKSEEEIHRFIDRCVVIRAVRFSGMAAPNPYDFGEEKINRARDLIKRTNSRVLLYENPDGVNVGSDEISGGLGIVQAGIGDAKITGTAEDGEREILETKRRLRTKRVDIEDDKDFVKKALEFAKD